MGERLRLAAAVVVDRDVDPLAEVLLGHRAIGEPVAGEDEGQHRASLVNAGALDPRQSGGMTDQPHDSVAPPPPPSPVLPPPPAPTFPATTLASPPGKPAFHPRGVLVRERVLGGPLTRASWVAGIAAALIVIVLVRHPRRALTLLLLPVVAAIGASSGSTLAALTMPSQDAAVAFEAFAWLGSREIRRFRARTARARRPRRRRVQQWLALEPPLVRDCVRAAGAARDARPYRRGHGGTGAAPDADHRRGGRRAGARAPVHGVHRDGVARCVASSTPSRRACRPDTELRLELLVARAIDQARARLAQGEGGLARSAAGGPPAARVGRDDDDRPGPVVEDRVADVRGGGWRSRCCRAVAPLSPVVMEQWRR